MDTFEILEEEDGVNYGRMIDSQQEKIKNLLVKLEEAHDLWEESKTKVIKLEEEGKGQEKVIYEVINENKRLKEENKRKDEEIKELQEQITEKNKNVNEKEHSEIHKNAENNDQEGK